MNRNRAHPLTPPRTRPIGGFTLVELVISILVFAILAAVSIPAYSTYVRKARRAEAKSALLDLAALEERYYSTQNVYSSTATDLGYTSWPATVGSGYYQIAAPTIVAATAPTATAPAGTAATYTFVATPIGDQVKDLPCQSFTVGSGGVQSATQNGGADNTQICWR